MTNPEFDTPDWRVIRDNKLREWIGNDWAIRWLLQYWDACELFDDLVDRDKEISDSRAIRCLYECLVDMPSNPFFVENAFRLIPIVSAGITDWVNATQLEKNPTEKNLRVSFVMRNAYMNILNTVIEITRGREVMLGLSMDIIDFFGHDSFEEYSSEHKGDK